MKEDFMKIKHELDAAPDPQGVVVKTFHSSDPKFKNGLYGPSSGDAPIAENDPGHEITHRARPGREGLSRLVNKPMRDTDLFTVVYGPHKDKEGKEYPKVLYTAFGGPPAEREPTDQYFKENPDDVEGYARAVKFWEEHALSHESF
jgi:hypothetical protein